MANKNIQLKDLNGNLLFPKTQGAVVFNNAGENLGGVEAGAQVNIIEKIKVNGAELPITDKAVDIAQVSYTIKKQGAAEEGYSATYQLFAGDAAIGDKINIPKDMVVSGGELKYCEVANVPVSGLEVNDPYIELTIANNDGTKLYIPVKGLVDIYTAGNGLKLENNEFRVNTEDATIADAAPVADSKKFVQSGGVKAELDKKVDANVAIAGATKCKITYDEKGLVTAGADLAAADIPNLDSAKINTLDNYAKAASFAAIEKTDTLNVALGKLEKGLDTKQATITGAATSIVDADLTASMVLVSDAQGKVAASAIPAATAFLTYEEIV